MRDLCRLISWMVVDLIRSRAALEAEIWTLRQQINILRRGAPRKFSFCTVDRMIFVGVYRMFPKICEAWRSSSRRPLFAGIAPVSDCTGVGSPYLVADGRLCPQRFASLSGR